MPPREKTERQKQTFSHSFVRSRVTNISVTMRITVTQTVVALHTITVGSARMCVEPVRAFKLFPDVLADGVEAHACTVAAGLNLSWVITAQGAEELAEV